MNGPKIYFTIPLFGGIPITQTTVSSFAVMLLLCIAGIVLGSNLQKRPSRRQVLVEKGVTMLYGMVEDTMGKHNSYWTPYIGALFLSSIFGSYIGMTGIFRSSTADLSTPQKNQDSDRNAFANQAQKSGGSRCQSGINQAGQNVAARNVAKVTECH